MFDNKDEGRKIDLFHTTRDYYQNKQFQPIMSNIGLPEFLKQYMLGANGTQQDADAITAYLTAKTNQPWCPGDEWPPAMIIRSSSSQANSSSAPSDPDPIDPNPINPNPGGEKTKLTHVVFAYGAVGSDPDGAGGWGHHDPTGEGIKHLVNKSGWPEAEGFKASLVSLQDSPEAFIKILNQSKNGQIEPIDAIVFQGAFGKVLWKGNKANTEAVQLFEEFIENGGGYAGFHTVVYLDKSNEWPYWWENIMLGKCCVKGHPDKAPPKVKVVRPNHPINAGFSKNEYNLNSLPRGNTLLYGFAGNLRSDIPGTPNYDANYKVILSTPYPEGSKTKQGALLTPHDRYPYAWAYDFTGEGKGRTFTTLLGNKQAFFSDSEWLEFMKASIRWVSQVPNPE